MIVPEESQHGGDTIITCDWGFNRNAKIVTFYQSTLKLLKEQLAQCELNSNGELIGNANIGNRTKYVTVLGTKRSVSLTIFDVLSNNAGPYWCNITVKGTSKWASSGSKQLNIKRRCNQSVRKYH